MPISVRPVVWMAVIAAGLSGLISPAEAVAARETGHSATAAATTRPLQLDVRLLISRRIGQMTLDRVPAKQAFDDWSRVTGVPMVIDWRALGADGIDPSQPITLKLHNLPASLVLDLMMREAAGATPGSSLVADANPYFVQVMTKTQANRQPVVRIYPVMDLVFVPFAVHHPPQFDLHSVLAQQNNTTNANGSGLFANQQNKTPQHDADARKKTLQKQIEKLQTTIRNTVEPKAWQAKGGKIAAMVYHEGLLIVRAPRYMQREVARLLGDSGQSLQRPMGWVHAAAAKTATPTDPTARDRSTIHKANVFPR